MVVDLRDVAWGTGDKPRRFVCGIAGRIRIMLVLAAQIFIH
jgi:hypothetical protein